MHRLGIVPTTYWVYNNTLVPLRLASYNYIQNENEIQVKQRASTVAEQIVDMRALAGGLLKSAGGLQPPAYRLWTW